MDKLSIKEILELPESMKDIWIKVLAQQLADTMRENERLRSSLEEICRVVEHVRLGTIKPTCGIYEMIANEALSYKESEDVG